MNVKMLRELVSEINKEYKECEERYINSLSPAQIKLKQNIIEIEKLPINTAEWYNSLVSTRTEFNISHTRIQRNLRKKLKSIETQLKEHRVIYAFERSENILKDLIYQDV